MFKCVEIERKILKDKIVVITGSSKGIGRSLADIFSQAGADVVVNYYREKDEAIKTKSIIESNGSRALLFKADVGNIVEVKEMVEGIMSAWGKIDILINNAGITQPTFFLNISEDDWERMISIHLTGTFNCCRHIVPLMIERKQGKIINMSSVVGKNGAIGAGAHYCAAKAGIIGFTKALANQLAPYGIQVNAIAPAMIDTEMIRWRSREQLRIHLQSVPLGRIGSVEEVAGAALFLASDYANYITGYTMDINGGMYMD